MYKPVSLWITSIHMRTCNTAGELGGVGTPSSQDSGSDKSLDRMPRLCLKNKLTNKQTNHHQQQKQRQRNLSRLPNACFNLCIPAFQSGFNCISKTQSLPKRLFKLNFSTMLTGMADIREYPMKLISKSHNLQFCQVFETEQRLWSLKTEQRDLVSVNSSET